jgi:hypothetical protein
MTRFQLAAELHRTAVAGITDLPPIPEITYYEFDADAESDDSLVLGGAAGQAPISLKHTEFSMTQFAKTMGQPKLSAFNKWKKVLVAGFLRKKYWSIIPEQNCMKQL